VTAQPIVDFEIVSPVIAVVTLLGEHDISTTESSVAAKMALASDYPYVLVDLTLCTFVDSLTVGAILNGVSSARALGGQLELVTGPASPRRRLHWMGVDKLIVMHDSRADGIDSLARRERAPEALQASFSELTPLSL
jgi:anti-anti-sigma regulatory factor